MNMSGVIVARMPRPVVDRGTVLIRVRYSLVSVGTEVAPLRPASVSRAGYAGGGTPSRTARLLKHYFRASLRDPRKAARRLSQIAEHRLSRARQAAPGGGAAAAAPAASDLNAQGWAIGYSVAGRSGRGRRRHHGSRAPAIWSRPPERARPITLTTSACRAIWSAAFRRAASLKRGGVGDDWRDRAAGRAPGGAAARRPRVRRRSGPDRPDHRAAAQGRRLPRHRPRSRSVPRRAGARRSACDAGATTPMRSRRWFATCTGGRGADRTLMTAATKSNAVINLAMELTRARKARSSSSATSGSTSSAPCSIARKSIC